MVANQFPVLDRPRTPTTSDDEMDPQMAESGLRIKHAYNESPVRSRLSGSFDRLSASPPDTASTSMNTGRTDLISPVFSLSTPADAYSPDTPHTVASEQDEFSEKEDELTSTAANPFNFTTQQYSATLSPAKPVRTPQTCQSKYAILIWSRTSMSANVAVTSTSTRVSRTKSSLNPHLAPLSNYLPLCPSLLAMRSNTA
jgi:hypothetical protein